MSAVDLHSLRYFAAAETPHTLLCSIKHWFMWHNASGTTHTSSHWPSPFFSAATLCFPSRQCAWWSTPGMLISSLETETRGSWHQSQQGLFTLTLSQKRETVEKGGERKHGGPNLGHTLKENWCSLSSSHHWPIVPQSELEPHTHALVYTGILSGLNLHVAYACY